MNSDVLRRRSRAKRRWTVERQDAVTAPARAAQRMTATRTAYRRGRRWPGGIAAEKAPTRAENKGVNLPRRHLDENRRPSPRPFPARLAPPPYRGGTFPIGRRKMRYRLPFPVSVHSKWIELSHPHPCPKRDRPFGRSLFVLPQTAWMPNENILDVGVQDAGFSALNTEGRRKSRRDFPTR